MHSFLIDMCRCCLTTNVKLKEYIVVEDEKFKCLDAVKFIFPNIEVLDYFGYSLCEVCTNLLKSAVIFQSRLSESHNVYSKYMKTLKISNPYKFSISIGQHVNKEYLSMPMGITDKGSVLKQSQNMCNQIPTNDTYFEDILNDEDLNCDTCNGFDNFLGELDTKLDIKQNILVKEEVLKTDNDNCNQMSFNITENILCVKNIKEEHENLIHESTNKIYKDIPMSDHDNFHQLDSKIEVEENIIPWESTNKGHANFENASDGENQCKNEILPKNLSTIDCKQEKTTTFNSKEKTSPILLTEHKVEHKKNQPCTGNGHCKCEVCKGSFLKSSTLIRNKCIHKGERPYKCDVCEKSFAQKSALTSHKRIHTGERPYKCDVCENSFSISSNLIKHKRIHTGERPYKCDVCEKSFSGSSNLKKHKRVHTGERPYKCDVCEKSFSLIGGFNAHKLLHTGERPYQCDVCEKSFSQPQQLIKHKHIHTEKGRYKCDVCEKIFGGNPKLIIHKRIHTGERPYKCNVCEKSFSRTGVLNKHMRIHTGERPYKCDVCEKSFSQTSNLIIHKRIHTKERPYKCDICEKSFRRNSHLIIHKRIHTKERPYKCDICEKSFRRNSHLIIHKRIHTKERPYKCDICEKSFRRNSHLIKHKRTHTRI